LELNGMSFDEKLEEAFRKVVCLEKASKLKFPVVKVQVKTFKQDQTLDEAKL
jgi:hypothetical protein